MSDINKQKYTEKVMRELADDLKYKIKKRTGMKMGFALLVFPFAKLGIANYISNVSRDQMIKVLEEKIKNLKNKRDMPPGEGSVQ